MENEKDKDWRAKVMRIYNKTEADFESADEFDEYLEEREDLIFDLTEGGP